MTMRLDPVECVKAALEKHFDNEHSTVLLDSERQEIAEVAAAALASPASPAPDAVLRERVADAIANADLDGPDPDDYWRHLADAAIAALASPASTAEGEGS